MREHGILFDSSIDCAFAIPVWLKLPGCYSLLPKYYHPCTLSPHSFPRTYCENLNKQVSGTELADKSLEEVVVAAWNGGRPMLCFNNAAQVSEGRSLWGEGRGGGEN